MGDKLHKRDMSEVKTRMSDFVVRRIIDAMGETNVVYANPKKQGPIGEPEHYGLKGFEERFVTSADGSSIGIWYNPPADPSKPTYVAFHGRGGHWGFADNKKPPKHRTPPFKNNCYRHNWLEAMAESGAGVVAVHTRGFGLSANPTVQSISEDAIQQDFVAVDQFLEAEKINPRSTIVTGESLGGGMATLMAETMAERGHAPGMLGLINTFTTMSGALHDAVSGFKLGKLQPMKWATEENISTRLGNPYDNCHRLSRLKDCTKLYIAHAPEDEVVPYDHSQTNLASGSGSQKYGNPVFREIVDNFRTAYERNHTNWSPDALVADMEASFHSHLRGNLKGTTSLSR